MQALFLLTQSRKLHNDSMCKKEEKKVISPYILNFLTHLPPE